MGLALLETPRALANLKNLEVKIPGLKGNILSAGLTLMAFKLKTPPSREELAEFSPEIIASCVKFTDD